MSEEIVFDEEKSTLKVFATFKSINYKGEVVEDVLEREIPFIGYDPVKFFKAMCENTIDKLPRPFTCSFDDFMETVFGISDSWKKYRALSVKSEDIAGLEFVIWDYCSYIAVMKWRRAS